MSVRDEWASFVELDMAPNAPAVQVSEMRRAFYAGVTSGLKLGIDASGDSEAVTRLLTEICDYRRGFQIEHERI
jgi:hypothetical protein